MRAGLKMVKITVGEVILQNEIANVKDPHPSSPKYDTKVRMVNRNLYVVFGD